MINIYNTLTKKVEEFSNTDAQNALKAGSHTVLEFSPIPMYSPTGDIYEVSGKEVYEALDEGWSIAPSKELGIQKTREEEPLLGPTKAFTLGAGRGATLGLTDLFAVNVLGVDPTTIKKYKESYPGISLASEIGGAIVPAFVAPGGAGLTSEVLSSMPTSYLSRSARALESLVAKNLTKMAPAAAVSPIAKTIVNSASMGLGSAVESSFYGLGRLISEDAMGDAQFNAENLAAYASEEFIIGGALGTAIPAFAGVTGKLAKTLTKKATDISGRLMPEGVLPKVLQTFTGVPEDLVDKYLKDPTILERAKSSTEIGDELFGDLELIRSKVATGEADVIATQDKISALKEGLKSSKKGSAQFQKDISTALKSIESEVKKRINIIKDDLKNFPPSENFIDSVEDSLTQLKADIVRLSKESYEALGDAPLEMLEPMPKNIALRGIDKIVDSMKVGEAGRVKVLVGDQEKTIAAKMHRYAKDIDQFGEDLLPSEIKSIIQKLDKDNAALWKQARMGGFVDSELKAVQGVRGIFNEYLREYAPYSEIMNELAPKTGFYGQAIRKLGERSKIRTAISQSYKNSSKERNEMVSQLGEYVGQDLNTPMLQYSERIQMGKAKFNSDRIAKMYGLEPGSDEYQRIKDQYMLQALQKDELGVPLDELINGKLAIVDDFEKKLVAAEGNLKKLKAQIDIGKQQMKTFGPATTREKAVSRVQSMSSRQSHAIKAAMQEVSALTGKDFVGMIEGLRLSESFNKSFLRGSRNVNLWSMMSAGAGSVGGPLGAMIGAGFGSVIGSVMDTFGPKIALALLRGIAAIKGKLTAAKVNEALSKAVKGEKGQYAEATAKTFSQVEKNVQKTSSKIESASKKFFNGVKRGVSVSVPLYLPKKDGPKEYKEYEKKIDEMLKNKESYLDDFAGETGILTPFAPETLAAYQATWMRAADYLERKFPRSDSPFDQDYIPSNIEMGKFLSAWAYVAKPFSIFDEIGSGYISPDGIEALNAVYPTIGAALSEEMMYRAVDRKNLSPSQKAQITLNFGIPLEIAALPQNLMRLQASGAGEEEEEKGQSKGKAPGGLRHTGLKNISLAEKTTGSFNQMANRKMES